MSQISNSFRMAVVAVSLSLATSAHAVETRGYIPNPTVDPTGNAEVHGVNLAVPAMVYEAFHRAGLGWMFGRRSL